MGGNASGLAVAARAKRAAGAPLFDQWFDVEGAVNVIEIYTAARALAATGNTMAANATADIEREMGGTIEERPEEYTSRTVVRRAEDVEASGVLGVTLVHGADDGARALQPEPRDPGAPARARAAGRHGHGRHARRGLRAGDDADGQLRAARLRRRRSPATRTRRARRTSSAMRGSSGCPPTSAGARPRTAASSWSTGRRGRRRRSRAPAAARARRRPRRSSARRAPARRTRGGGRRGRRSRRRPGSP